MTQPIISNILRTSSEAFDIPLPCTQTVDRQPALSASSSAFFPAHRIGPLLTNGLWTMAQHASYMDRDSSAMALCALLASRMVRFSAGRVLSARGGKRL